MIRIIYNDGIMDRNILRVQELDPKVDKLTNYWWRQINDEAMWLACEAESGMVSVQVVRVEGPGDYWYREDMPMVPTGDLICTGMASRLLDEVMVCWWRSDCIGWKYRTSSMIVRRFCYD